MATSKVLADKPQFLTGVHEALQGEASVIVPVDPKTGKPVPAEDALEVQRKGMEQAAKDEQKNLTDEQKDLKVTGEEADFLAAKANPAASGHTSVQDVEKQEAASKDDKKSKAK